MEEQGSAGHRIRRISTVTPRVRNRKKAIQRTCNRVVHNCDSKEKFVSGMPYHAVFVFLIPLLVAVLQLSNQATNNKYSFETHPETFWTFLLATLVYCFAVGAGIKYQFYNPSYVQPSSLVAVISGSLSSISLVSILLPHSIRVLIFVVWASLSTVVSHGLVISLCCWIYQIIMKIFFQVAGIWNRFRGSGLELEQLRVSV